jgi:two-component system, NarL family, response regulator NreC
MPKLRVLLAEDHKVMREGLRMLVERDADMEIIGEADNGSTAIELARQLKPAVVVMDISMPEVNGLKATEILRASIPETKILILTRHSDASYVQQLLRSGASGYVLKHSAFDELVHAIKRVAAGYAYIDPAVLTQVVGSISAPNSTAGTFKPLTERERTVLREVATGFLTKEIAAHMNISPKTVETHKANAMAKLGMKSRIDIVRYAILQGWLHDP